MKTKQEVMEFVADSASAALDNGDGFADPIGSHECNVVDTINDAKMQEHMVAALHLYRELVKLPSWREVQAWIKANH